MIESEPRKVPRCHHFKEQKQDSVAERARGRIAMSERLLRFESAKRNLGLLKSSTPHSQQIGAWRIFERLRPHPHEDLRKQSIGEYKVVMERPVATQDEVWQGLREATQFATELDVAWCYAWCRPFNALKFAWRGSEAPEHWSGNLREVERDIQKAKGGLFVAAVGLPWRDWTWWPSLPLERAMANPAGLCSTPRRLSEI